MTLCTIKIFRIQQLTIYYLVCCLCCFYAKNVSKKIKNSYSRLKIGILRLGQKKMKYSDKINFVNRDDKKLLGGIQMNTQTFEQFDVLAVNFSVITDSELAELQGGGIIGDVGNFVGNTWNTLYNTGRDFGRSVVNAIMK